LAYPLSEAAPRKVPWTIPAPVRFPGQDE
jgi:hypothetical protein